MSCKDCKCEDVEQENKILQLALEMVCENQWILLARRLQPYTAKYWKEQAEEKLKGETQCTSTK